MSIFEFILGSSIFIITILVVFVTLVRGAPYYPTPNKYVLNMVKLVNLRKGEKTLDVGSGDGRMVMIFAQAGAEATGIEINPLLVLISRFRLWKAGLKNARIKYGDMFKEDFTQYDVVTVFIMKDLMGTLEEKLKKELKPGAKVVSYGFEFPKWELESSDKDLYLYVQK